MTLAEETQLELQAKQRRTQRETIEGNISAAEQRVATIDREIAEKKKLLTALSKLDAAAIELPAQVQAKTVVVGGAGLHSSTIPCLRTELRASLTGALQVQSARLHTLVVRRDAEAKRLDELRDGIKEFQEVGA
jgi:hypothetical protein